MPTNASYDEIYKNRWLKADDLPDEDLIVIIKDVIDEEVGERRERKFVLSFHELEKELILNQTNGKVLADRFGKDPNGWVGKKIALFSTEVSFAGKMTLAIRIRLRAPGAAAKVAPVTTKPEPVGADSDIPW